MSIGIRTDVKSFDDVRKSLGLIDRVLSKDSVRTIQSDGTDVGDHDITILDFSDDFLVIESPDGHITISIISYFRLVAKALADSTVANTASETAFATTFSVAANSMAVGQVYKIRASGVLSTV